MRVLALDTTTRAGSVAIVDADRVVGEREGDAARSHTEQLPTALTQLMMDCAVSLSSIDVFAVAAGPGSFTGLRSGIATMQGLAFATGRRIVTVSALEAIGQIAAVGAVPGAIIGVWKDAFRREVFCALYRVADRPAFTPERLIEIDAARVADPAATLARWRAGGMWPAVVMGDGAIIYGALLDGRTQATRPPPLAAAIGRMGGWRAGRGLALEPAAVQPLYIRRPDAEVERERKVDSPAAHAE